MPPPWFCEPPEGCERPGTHDEGSSAVLPVRVLKEDVDAGGGEGIQEGEDGDGDEELCGGWRVSNEEHTLPPRALTHGRLEGHLVQPDTHTHTGGNNGS